MSARGAAIVAGSPDSRFVPNWHEAEPRAHRIDSVDWQAVARAFARLSWSWSGEGVPTAASIKQTAAVLHHSASKGGAWSSTGGLKVYADGALDFHPSIEAELKRLAEEPAP